MATYLLRRMLLMIPTLLGITFIVVALMLWAPGEPTFGMESVSAEGGGAKLTSSQSLNKAKEAMGFFDADGNKKNVFAAWITWLGKFATLDLGESWKFKKPVTQLLWERVPVTMLLSGLSILLTYLISIPLGVRSATRIGTIEDGATTTALFALYSMPNWWVAILLILCFSSASGCNWIPVDGLHDVDASTFTSMQFLGDLIVRLILPVFCLTYASFASLSRYMRSGLLEVVRQDYVRTARAKGLDERRVVWTHAFQNALIPIITLLAGLLPSLVGGSIIIELIFSIDGMG
ncbi:MAG: ABC transporter permease, partial [Planctomycetes bacterium]|nr:ABC transporter permease [Planctomycetota bacterium]